MGTLERMAMKVLAISAATLLVCAIVAVAMLNTTADFQDLAGKAAKAKATSKALSYGSTVTLMNPYNLYMLVQKNGEINMGGFLHGNNNIKIVSPGGKKGAVKYGDEVSLMGENGKYFLVRYSGKITSRASVIARDTKWKILAALAGFTSPTVSTSSPSLATFTCPTTAAARLMPLLLPRSSSLACPARRPASSPPMASTTVRSSASRTAPTSGCRPTTMACSPSRASRLATGTTSPSSAPSTPRASSRTATRLFSVHTMAAWCLSASTPVHSRPCPAPSPTSVSSPLWA